MSKHTSGPWKVSRSGTTVLSESGRFIADCLGPNSQEQNEPNARLIAAAPELLEALKEAQQHINGGSGIKQGMEWKAMYDKIRAAIAKAEA